MKVLQENQEKTNKAAISPNGFFMLFVDTDLGKLPHCQVDANAAAGATWPEVLLVLEHIQHYSQDVISMLKL